MKNNLVLKSMRLISLTLIIALFFTWNPAQATEKDSTKLKFLNWHNADFQKDNKMGVGTERSYNELLKGKKAKKIVVAIIDSGVDIEHEDLKGNIWINPGEIAGNGIDDDGNGYIDDVYGWNFLGGAKGENVDHETLEVTRIYRKLYPKYKNKSAGDIKATDKQEFELYTKVRKEYEEEYNDAKAQLDGLTTVFKKFTAAEEVIKKHLNKFDLTLEEVKSISQGDNEELNNAVKLLTRLMGNGFGAKVYDEAKEHYEASLKYHLNIEFNPRLVIGDNPENFKDSIYGNGDIIGKTADHGTHVAGIVAAVRANGIGLDGIADNALIMAIRVVPDGDERDKDVANGIRYAVNNGAKIINMSFGKTHSPNAKEVYEAMKYAESRGVLLIHAAGNSSENIDKIIHYPVNNVVKNDPVKSYICVGASSMNSDHTLRGNFSNFGKSTVDIFAPGVKIYSTVPDNKYETFNGTSMASPVVAGVAALVWSYYPEFTANEIKEILMESSVNMKKHKVLKPNVDPKKDKKTKFGKLSKTGGIVNAYEALKLAERRAKK